MKKQEKGITLVALVVTIIVLLILAGIAINLTIGNNGLFVRAKLASLEHRGANVEEQVNLWKMDKKSAVYDDLKYKKEKDLLDDLEINQKILTNEERNKLENERTVTIGSKIITLDDEKEMINYTVIINVILDGTEYIGDFKCSVEKQEEGNTREDMVPIKNDNSSLQIKFETFRSIEMEVVFCKSEWGVDLGMDIFEMGPLADGDVINIDVAVRNGEFVLTPEDLISLGFKIKD